jgi:GTP-binding protein
LLRRAQDGLAGENKTLRLELKLLADVGLVGFPNAGKSTLISSISAARPKIADYPFTTLVPQLGVVAHRDRPPFVLADIPGLIEGAHQGAGLGHRFLRHVERCRLLLHLVDPTAPGRDPVADVETIDRELSRYRAELSGKPQILVLTKLDALQDEGPAARLREHAARAGRRCFAVSAVTGRGIPDLLDAVSETLERLPPP